LRFPELYRRLAVSGAEVLFVPSAFTRETGRDHWEVLLRARAIENLCYVVAPAQAGEHVRESSWLNLIFQNSLTQGGDSPRWIIFA
jgi:predicted amidohydrolase